MENAMNIIKATTFCWCETNILGYSRNAKPIKLCTVEPPITDPPTEDNLSIKDTSWLARIV